MKDLGLASVEALIGIIVPISFLLIARVFRTPHKARLEVVERDRLWALDAGKSTYEAMRELLRQCADKADWKPHFPKKIQSCSLDELIALEDGYRSRPTSAWSTWNSPRDPKSVHRKMLASYATLRASARIQMLHDDLRAKHVSLAGASPNAQWRRRWGLVIFSLLFVWYLASPICETLSQTRFAWGRLADLESWTATQSAMVGMLLCLTALAGLFFAWTALADNDHYWRRATNLQRIGQVAGRVLLLIVAPVLSVAFGLLACGIGEWVKGLSP